LETDKATMDVPSPAAGRVAELKIAVGDRVSAGDLLLSLEAGAEGETAPAAAGAAAAPPAASAEGPGAAPAEEASEKPAAAHPAPRSNGGTQPDAEPKVVQVPDLGDFADVEVIEVL